MRIRSLIVGLVAAASLWLVPEQTSEALPQKVMNFGTMAPTGTPWSDQLAGIEKRIEADSAGAIQVKLFLGGSLGAELEMIRDTARGERLQAGGFSTGAIGEAVDAPILNLVELPYLFNNEHEADVVLDDILTQPVTAALASKGIQFYAWAENGWRSMGTKGGSAANIEDLRKFKMRSQENPVHLDMWKALGVQAVAKPTTEVLPALKTGIIDGFDNSPLLTMAAGWTESITHFTLTRHIYQPAAVVYSKVFYDSLTPDLQQVLMKNAKEESANGRKGVRDLEEELLATMGEMGVEVVTPTEEQLKAYRQLTRPGHKQFLAQHPDLVPVYTQVKTKLTSLRQ